MKFFMKVLYFLVLNSLCINKTYSNEGFDKVQYNTTQVTSSIFMLEGAGGNITANIEKTVFIVDDDFAEINEKLVSKLKELNGAKPRFIINTHFHYDHTGGNELFKKATIIASESVKDRLNTEQTLWKRNIQQS